MLVAKSSFYHCVGLHTCLSLKMRSWSRSRMWLSLPWDLWGSGILSCVGSPDEVAVQCSECCLLYDPKASGTQCSFLRLVLCNIGSILPLQLFTRCSCNFGVRCLLVTLRVMLGTMFAMTLPLRNRDPWPFCGLLVRFCIGRLVGIVLGLGLVPEMFPFRCSCLLVPSSMSSVVPCDMRLSRQAVHRRKDTGGLADHHLDWQACSSLFRASAAPRASFCLVFLIFHLLSPLPVLCLVNFARWYREALARRTGCWQLAFGTLTCVQVVVPYARTLCTCFSVRLGNLQIPWSMRLLAWLMILAVTPLASFVLDSLLSLPGCLFDGNIFVSGLWLGTFLTFLVFLTGFMLMGVHLTNARCNLCWCSLCLLPSQFPGGFVCHRCAWWNVLLMPVSGTFFLHHILRLSIWSAIVNGWFVVVACCANLAFISALLILIMTWGTFPCGLCCFASPGGDPVDCLASFPPWLRGRGLWRNLPAWFRRKLLCRYSCGRCCFRVSSCMWTRKSFEIVAFWH